VYVRRVGKRTLEFGHQGWLLDESFIFYDKQFDSLWVQATGTCIFGRFKGEQLATVPVTHTTWGQWRTLHPDTTVLAKPKELISRYQRDSYEASYRKWGTQFGLAVFVEGAQKLYPLGILEDRPVVNDEIGGKVVLVVYHSATKTAVAFDPTVQGERLQFELEEAGENDVRIRAKDLPGVIWSGLTGRPVSGGENAPSLRQLRTSQFVLSNWPKHFPTSPVFGMP